MKPDAARHNPDPEYLRELLRRAGISQREAARLLGIGERAMRYHLSGDQRYPAPYTVQFCLEALAAEADGCERCGHSYGPDWLDEGETCPRCKLVQ